MQLRESALTLQATQDALFPLVGNIELLSIAMTLVQRLTKVVEYRREGLHLALALFQLFDTLTKHIDSLVSSFFWASANISWASRRAVWIREEYI